MQNSSQKPDVIKEGDFVELEFTGMTSDNIVFDTTSREVAEKSGLLKDGQDYRPIVICIGKGQLIKGLDSQLIGKEAGKEYTIAIAAEDGFGKRQAKLLQMVPIKKFTENNIKAVPGLELNVDGVFGVVKSVTGGRVLVDFNHPLASKDLIYKIKVNRIVKDTKERLESYLKSVLKDVPGFELDKTKGLLKLSPISLDEAKKEKLAANIKELIPEIKEVSFG